MRSIRRSAKGIAALLLALVLVVTAIACASVANAAETKAPARTGADNYYLWGIGSNDPDFGAMSSPTGSFSYDGTKGYYYYDLNGSSGDYCFVVSKVNNSGATAVRTPAIGGAAEPGQYYLSQGNYHGYTCLHLWNPAGEAVRLYFSSESTGIYAVPQSGGGSSPTTGPVTPPSAKGSVYCKNSAGWGAVYAYMWNGNGGAGNENSSWPGVKMTDLGSGEWKYQYTSAYANIIFNNGSDKQKTTDLTLPGDGYIYDNGSGSWSKHGDSPEQPTSQQPTSQQPTSAPPVTTGEVYCKNSAGWGAVYAYMWNGSGGAGNENSSWPGVKMTDLGSGEWQYLYSASYSNIIFNNGSDQAKTTDLTLPGSGYIYDNGTGSWSKHGDSPEPPTTQQPTSQQPTSAPATSSSGGEIEVFCENEAGWPVVSVYMWNGAGSANNGAWPGPSATKVGGNLWRYVVPRPYDNVIFSDAGHDQTSDLKFPGSGYVYNNKTKEWTIHDTSPLKVTNFTTDLTAPQYAGVGIVMSAAAEGQGIVRYRFSATNSSGSTIVVRDFSANNSAVWTPKTAGKYTLTFDFRDSAGNVNQRTLTYTVEDGLSSVSPFIKQVTPISGQQIKKSAQCTVNVSAAGGLTGTKLLFYKYTVKDPSGNVCNLPYYSLKNSFSFSPAGLGNYTVTVHVQGSNNETVERTYVYSSVANVETPTEPEDPSTNIKGDADNDGVVSIIDVTRIQRYLAGKTPETLINLTNADVDENKKVEILDATLIQRYLAGLSKTLKGGTET